MATCKLTYRGVRYDSSAELEQAIGQTTGVQQQEEESSATIDVVEANGFRTYVLKEDSSGEIIGRVRTQPTTNGYVVESSLVKPEYQNQGIGTAIYTEAITDLISRGETLYSDTNVEPQANSVWSKLMDEGLAIFNSEIGRYEASPTPETLDSNGEASSQEVLNFVQQSNMEDVEVTSEDRQNIIDSMVGFENTYQMIDQTKRAFMFKGTFRPTFESLTNNGYTIAEAENILSDLDLQYQIRENLGKLENLENDIEVEAGEYTETASVGEVDMLGRFKRDNPYELKKRAIEELGGIQSESEFQNRIEDTDFEVFSEQFEEFSQYKRAPVMRYTEEGELENSPIKSPAELTREYMDAEYNGTLDRTLETVLEATQDILEFNTSSTKTVIKTIEREAAKSGLDIVGIYEKYQEKGVEATQAFLQEYRNLNAQGINENFVEAYNTFFDVGEGSEIFKTTREGNVLKIENSQKTAAESFVEDGMLYVGENIYREVDNSLSLEQAMEVAENRLDILPREIFNKVNMSNQESIRKAIEEHLDKQLIEVEHTSELTEDQKKVFLINSMYFATPINKVDQVKLLNDTDLELNTQEYQREFYKEMLLGKISNSTKYQNLYSKIEATQEGLNIEESDPFSMRMIEEIADDRFKTYMSLKKDSDINFFEGGNKVEENQKMRDQYFNYPKSLKKYQGVYDNLDSNTITTRGETQDFIRTREGVYELADYNGETAYYTRLGENTTNFIQKVREVTGVNQNNVNLPSAVEGETRINNAYTKEQGQQIQDSLEC